LSAGTSGAGDFHTTRWSVVRGAASDSVDGRAALGDLCTIYWFPLYGFLRRRGEDAHDAADLTQGFFCGLLERRDFEALEPAAGRFRAWLLACLKNHLANAKRRAAAQKRGGDRRVFSIDENEANVRYESEAPDADSPERVFERLWAQSVLARALERVAAEYEMRGRARLFEALRGNLVGEASPASLRRVADQLELNEGATRVALHRLRGHYREALRREIADTVSDPSEVSEELNDLLEALSG
jgi:RNA polymerase sigma-70 factor (ECF subfamily)